MKMFVRRFAHISTLICVVAALATAAASAAEIPKIAVYVAGGRDAGEDKAVMTLILAALINSGRYEAVERSRDFVAQINREMDTQYSGAVDDSQIMRLGAQAGVQFVCVADLAQAFGAYQISARIIDVETAKIIASGAAGSDMKTIGEIETLANDVVARMLGLKGGQGESAAEKRMRKRAETEKRRKVEIDRRKRAEARARDEDAVRKESEKADRVERRRLEKAQKAELRERGKRSADGKEGVAWHIYSAGLHCEAGAGTAAENRSLSTAEYSAVLTLKKGNGSVLGRLESGGWERNIDLMLGYYDFRRDSGDLNIKVADYRGIEAAAFKGRAYEFNSNWGCVADYGLAGYIGAGAGSGLGGGGRFGIIYRGLRFDEYKDFLVFSADVRLMYNGIFAKDEFFTSLKISAGISVSYAFRSLAEGSDNSGAAYEEKGGYDRATRQAGTPNGYNQYNATLSTLYNNKGVAYSEEGDYDNAIEDLKHALRLDPNNAAATRNLATAYNNRGVAYSEKGDYDRAVEDYKQAVRLDPNNATANRNLAVAYNNRAVTYSSDSEYEDAAAYKERAREHSKATSYASDYEKVGGDYDKLIEAYNQAIRANPNDAESYYRRGLSYFNRGGRSGNFSDYDKAIADFNKAIQLNPNLNEAKQRLEYTKKLLGR